MTPLEIEEDAKRRYNAEGDSAFPTAMTMSLINQACMELAVETNCIRQTYSTTSVADQKEYSFPTNAFMIKRVEYDGIKVIPSRLDRDPKSSTTEPTGTPARYAIWNYEIHFFPTPDESSKTIKLFTLNRPQTVTSSSTLEVPDEYHPGIVDFVLSYMFAKDKDPTMSQYHLQLWRESKRWAKRHEMRKKRGDRFSVVADEIDLQADPGILV